MSDTYYVKTFGGLEITNDNVTVNIVELFGKQLVNLLQVLLFHSEKPVQKDELIDILWPESKNPSSALNLKKHITKLMMVKNYWMKENLKSPEKYLDYIKDVFMFLLANCIG